MSNKNLTAANEAAVLALVQDCKLKAVWQNARITKGHVLADALVASRCALPLQTVRAARYYW
jgi:hypothetical protein